MKRLEVVMHRTERQIHRKYRACRDAARKTRWHVIWLLARSQPRLTSERVAELVGLSGVAVRRILARWNERGPLGLLDGRRHNGSAPLLSRQQQQHLKAVLLERPADGGLWTGPKLVQYVRDRFGVRAHPHTGWRWLTQFGFSLQVPRPRHPEAAGRRERREWKRATATDGPGPPREAPRQGR